MSASVFTTNPVKKSAVFAMPYGEYGGASFAPDTKTLRRRFLWRAWASEPLAGVSVRDQERFDRGDWASLSKPFALFIGHNPSKADGSKNDMTILRELFFTKRMGHCYFLKVNACDICATDPAELDKLLTTHNQDNLDLIAQAASHATDIVFATGAPHRLVYRACVDLMQDLSHRYGAKVKCLGLTATGWPRHPSRLASSADLDSLGAALRRYEQDGRN